MKYIVSAYVGFDNFGDEVIANILTKKLKEEGAEKITFISSHPHKTAMMHQVYSCGMLNFFKSMKEADVLISGGGSLLQDVTSIKSLLYYLAVIYTAFLFGKKVVIYSQGIGPINSFIGRLLTKVALKNASEITVRDKKSQELLKSWGIESELVQDPVFSLNFQHKNKKGAVGIQLRSFRGVTTEFLEKLSDVVAEKFGDKKINILSLQDSVDNEVCEEFEQLLKTKGIENVQVCNQMNIEEVFEVISELEYLVSMRFHACVVGLKSGVKTLAVNYDPKVEKLAEEYNLPVINLEEKTTKEDIICSFNKLLEYPND